MFVCACVLVHVRALLRDCVHVRVRVVSVCVRASACACEHARASARVHTRSLVLIRRSIHLGFSYFRDSLTREVTD